MPGIVFILQVYTPVRGSGNLVPALIKKKKKCRGGARRQQGAGGATIRRTAGILLAVGVRGDGRSKEELTYPGF